MDTVENLSGFELGDRVRVLDGEKTQRDTWADVATGDTGVVAMLTGGTNFIVAMDGACRSCPPGSCEIRNRWMLRASDVELVTNAPVANPTTSEPAGDAA